MNVLRRLALVFSVILGLVAQVSAQSPPVERAENPRFAPADVDTILLQLHALLRVFHPFAHEVRGRESIDATVAELREGNRARGASDSLSLSELFALVADLRAVVGDGHFQVEFGDETEAVLAEAAHFYDLATARSDSGAVVVVADVRLADTVALPAGAELLTLEGATMTELLGELAYVGFDDHGVSDPAAYVAALNLPYFFQQRFGYRDSLHLTYRLGGQNRTAVLPATHHMLSAEESERAPSYLDDYIHLDTTALPDVLRLHLLSFSREEYGRGNAKRQLRRIMRYVDKRDPRALIVDVRDNTGGALRLVDEVYSYFARGTYRILDDARAYHPIVTGATPSTRHFNRVLRRVVREEPSYVMPPYAKPRRAKRRRHFDGEVIVLTDELTFSGASILAHLVQHYERGRVVGQAPGGSAERVYAGQFYYGRVGPGGALRVRVPLWRLDLVGENRGNVRPDVRVPRTRADLVEGRDRALEVAEDMLRE